jgi:hypothetical protein
MEKTYRQVWILFAVVFVIVFLGFFRTYFIKFPGFENTYPALHFHAFVFLSWFVLLFIQPYLIKKRKYALHRKLGKVSYFLVPLIALSTFGVARGMYLRELGHIPQNQNIGSLIVPFTQTIVFVTLYLLAIRNKKRVSFHLRYIIATSLVLIGPAIRRILGGWMHIPGQLSFLLSFLIMAGALIGLMVYDKIHGKKFQPYVVSLVLFTAYYLAVLFVPQTAVWQSFCGRIAQTIF